MRAVDAFHRDIVGITQKFDYDTRTDGQPVYAGFARNDVGDDTAKWVVHYFQYDGDNNVSTIICKEGAWSGRVALFA